MVPEGTERSNSEIDLSSDWKVSNSVLSKELENGLCLEDCEQLFEALEEWETILKDTPLSDHPSPD